jgi:hypothetical protein
MTQYSGLKRRIRARTAITGEPYSVARRAVMEDLEVFSQAEVERLIGEVQDYLSGKGRWLVPHGFKVASVQDGTAILEMPVIWDTVKGAIPLRASETPSPDNVNELKALFEQGLGSGRFLPNARLTERTTTMQDGPRPGNLDWTVRVRVGG